MNIHEECVTGRRYLTMERELSDKGIELREITENQRVPLLLLTVLVVARVK